VKLRESSTEMLEMLQNAYRTEAMTQDTIFQLRKHFKATDIREVDNAQGGRPSNDVIDVNIYNAEQMLKDRRLSLRKMTACLNVSLEKVHHTLRVELGMSQVCTRWFIVTLVLSREKKMKYSQ
jgi:hypothetical protein